MAKTYTDPICGIEVSPETAAAKYKQEGGETVYFCSVGCKNKYASRLKGKITGEHKKHAPASTNENRPNDELCVSDFSLKREI